MMKIFWLNIFLSVIVGTGLYAQSSLDTTLLADELSTVIVRAQYLPTDVRNSVNTVRIINARTINQRAVNNLEELLQTELGLRISQDAVLGSSFSINGLQGQNVKVLVDGVPVVGRLNGSVDPGQLPLHNVVQVEIIEGAQSLLYGSDASAGVINLVTRKSQLKLWETQVQTQAESNGFQRVAGQAGIQSGAWHFALHGNAQQFNPTIDTSMGRDQLWNPKVQHSLGSKLRYRPSERIDLRLNANWFDEQVDNLGEIRRPQFQAYAFDDYYQTTRRDISLHGEGRTANELFWQTTIARNQFDRIKNTYRYEFSDDSQALVDGQQDTSANLGWLGRFTLASDRKERTFNYLLGVELYHETAEGVRIIDSTAEKTGIAYNRDHAIFGSVKAQLLDRRLITQAGLRYTYNIDYGSALNPTIWLMYQPDKDWKLRTSYAQGFRAPRLKERYFNFIDVNHFIIGNTDLSAERSHNWRMEVTFPTWAMGPKSNVSMVANGFYNVVHDRIVLTETATNEYSYANLSQWETTGGGLTAEIDFHPKVSLRTGLLYTGFYNTLSEDADSLQRFNWSPDWSNELNVRLAEDQFTLTLWHKLTGKRPYFFQEGDRISPGESEGWHQLNASVQGLFWSKRIALTLGGKNLLDVQQIRTGGTSTAHSSGGEVSLQSVHWGRTWFASLQFSLSGGKE